MLVYAGGRERTVDEFRDLQVVPTAANVSVIEAVAK